MKIICVDNSILHLRSLGRWTRSVVPDAEIHTTRSPDEAVRLAKTEGCDVLLTEIEVGWSHAGGILLAEQIKKVNPKVNIIFVTVCSEHEYAAQMIQMKISGYITRPFALETLSRELHNLRYAVG